VLPSCAGVVRGGGTLGRMIHPRTERGLQSSADPRALVMFAGLSCWYTHTHSLF